MLRREFLKGVVAVAASPLAWLLGKRQFVEENVEEHPGFEQLSFCVEYPFDSQEIVHITFQEEDAWVVPYKVESCKKIPMSGGLYEITIIRIKDIYHGEEK